MDSDSMEKFLKVKNKNIRYFLSQKDVQIHFNLVFMGIYELKF